MFYKSLNFVKAYQRSTMVIPLIRSCRVPVSVQARNLWGFRSLDIRNIIRDAERLVEHAEGALFSDIPHRINRLRIMPIKGKEAIQDSSYRLNIDVEGFKPEDIKISLKEKVLKIEANMDEEAEDGSRFKKSFERQFNLPSNVELSTLKSLLYEDGILSIEAQIIRQNQTTEIPIQHLQDEETPKRKM